MTAHPANDAIDEKHHPKKDGGDDQHPIVSRKAFGKKLAGGVGQQRKGSQAEQQRREDEPERMKLKRAAEVAANKVRATARDATTGARPAGPGFHDAQVDAQAVLRRHEDHRQQNQQRQPHLPAGEKRRQHGTTEAHGGILPEPSLIGNAALWDVADLVRVVKRIAGVCNQVATWR